MSKNTANGFVTWCQLSENNFANAINKNHLD